MIDDDDDDDYDDDDEARSSRPARILALKRYKQHCVTPAFDAYDQDAFAASLEQHSWPYASFQPCLGPLPPLLLELNWEPHTWKHYRVWSTVRVLGRWPLALFGAGELPEMLPLCPLCGAEWVTIAHPLALCHGTWDLYLHWRSSSASGVGCPTRPPWPELRTELFSGRLGFVSDDEADLWFRITFTGQVFERIADLIHSAS